VVRPRVFPIILYVTWDLEQHEYLSFWREVGQLLQEESCDLVIAFAPQSGGSQVHAGIVQTRNALSGEAAQSLQRKVAAKIVSVCGKLLTETHAASAVLFLIMAITSPGGLVEGFKIARDPDPHAAATTVTTTREDWHRMIGGTHKTAEKTRHYVHALCDAGFLAGWVKSHFRRRDKDKA
jgi:hypothetical protein